MFVLTTMCSIHNFKNWLNILCLTNWVIYIEWSWTRGGRSTTAEDDDHYNFGACGHWRAANRQLWRTTRKVSAMTVSAKVLSLKCDCLSKSSGLIRQQPGAVFRPDQHEDCQPLDESLLLEWKRWHCQYVVEELRKKEENLTKWEQLKKVKVASGAANVALAIHHL